MRKNLYESNHSIIAYDYRIIIIIREYEIFTEYKIHMIVCLEPRIKMSEISTDISPIFRV